MEIHIGPILRLSAADRRIGSNPAIDRCGLCVCAAFKGAGCAYIPCNDRA
jgi:hypothetical protein